MLTNIVRALFVFSQAPTNTTFDIYGCFLFIMVAHKQIGRR